MKANTQHKKQGEARGGERWLVGMDLHSEQATVCVTRWRFGSEPKVHKESEVALDRIEAYYRRHVPEGALTVVEATTNAFDTAKRLEAEGYEVAVVCSDALKGMTRGDKVNDRHDARNLARAWARGSAREVHVPTEGEASLRELHFGRRDAVRAATAAKNRIWAFCKRLGLKRSGGEPARRNEGITAQVPARFDPASHEAFRWRTLHEEATRCEAILAAYEERVESTVAAHPDAASLMQVLGIGPVNALALCAFIGDARRFATSSKLVAYVGLNPSVCQSGKSQSGGSLSHFGRRDVKWLLIEGAHKALAFGKSAMCRWARRKILQGKEEKVVLCALARKMLVAAWHILMGHPPLDPAISPNHERKLLKVARAARRTGTLAAMGFKTSRQYVLHVASATSARARVRGELVTEGPNPNTPSQIETLQSKSQNI